MEKEENHDINSTDQNQDTVKGTEKPEENLAEENQKTNQESKEKISNIIAWLDRY